MPISRDASRTWLDACADFYGEQSQDFPVLETLKAFTAAYPRGGGPAPVEKKHQGTFEQLEASFAGQSALPDIALWIVNEIDREQIEIFSRRLDAVDTLLQQITHPAARVLRVGFRIRLQGILEAQTPYATRLRALADFYYSQGALLSHINRHRLTLNRLPSLNEQVRALQWESVGVGVQHACLNGVGQLGPMHINILKVEASKVALSTIRTRDVSSNIHNFGDLVMSQGAIAGVSGGFFLYSEPDIKSPSQRFDPVGLLIHKGEIVSPPIFNRSSLLVRSDGNVSIKKMGLSLAQLHIGGRDIGLKNAINRAASDVGPDSLSIAVAGNKIVEIGRRLPVPLNGCVVPMENIHGLSIEDRVSWRFCRTDHQELSWIEGIAGGPGILHQGVCGIDMEGEQFWRSAPPLTFSQDETGDQNLLGRLAVGIDDQQNLVFAAIDGRNIEQALGLTLAQTGQLMHQLGCHSAMNLDGGASKRMAIGDQIVDLPSTEMLTKSNQSSSCLVRPVHTCILFSSRHESRSFDGFVGF